MIRARALFGLALLVAALGAPGAAVAADAERPTANLLGHVLDSESGVPVQGASVTFETTSTTRITSALGYFTFTDVPVGVHYIRIEALGYETIRLQIRLEDNESYETEIFLGADAIQLEGLTVSVISRKTFNELRDLDLRLERGSGQFLLPQELEERGGNLITLLQGMRGVRIGGAGGGTMTDRTVRLRNAAHLTSSAPGVHEVEACYPAIFVDGRRYSRRASLGDQATDLTVFLAMDLEAVEVYSGASVPAIFGGGDAACGAILIWMRRGPARRGGGG